MSRHIESTKGLMKLADRMCGYGFEHCDDPDFNHEEFDYWHKVVAGCLSENLAMDEVDYENAPTWFRELWRGLK